MKKMIKILICAIFIVSSFTAFIPNKVYGICNTVRFTKEVSAVQLILADGTVLDDARIEKSVPSQTNILPNAYKDLDMIFIVKTDNGIEQNKTAVSKFVEKIYELYQGNTSRIKMGIIPFEECSQDELDARGEDVDVDQNILKNNKEEILNEISNLNEDNNQQLNEALMIAQNNFINNPKGASNDVLLQYVILITDEIESEEVCIASNTILMDLSNNMVGIYAIFVGVNQNSNENLKNLTNLVLELVVANDISLADVEYQLTNSVYQYISQFIIRESALMPTGGGPNMLLTPNSIILFADEELAHGATLKIEYVMSLSRYALYGSGTIYEARIIDKKDPKLTFDRDAALLTEPSKTNADYGWEMTAEGLTTTGGTNTIKLLLSTVITPEGLGEGRYSNTATCSTSFDVGFGSTARYSVSDKALDVQILPPFGEENVEKGKRIWIMYVIIGMTLIILIGVVVAIKTKKTNKA